MPVTATVKEIFLQLMNLNVDWEDIRLQFVENDNGTFSATPEQLTKMFDDLMQIRRDLASRPKPQTIFG